MTGAGAIFNLYGGYFIYNTYPTGEQADAAAIRRDWWKTAEDLRTAIEVSKRQYWSEQSR
jgi:hypothetical protein